MYYGIQLDNDGVQSMEYFPTFDELLYAHPNATQIFECDESDKCVVVEVTEILSKLQP